MISANLTLLELIAILMIYPIGYLFVKLVKFFKKEPSEVELDKLFSLYWNGSPEDKIYAWYKVRYILTQREKNQHMLDIVNRKIDGIDRGELCGSMLINSSGELIDERQTGSKIL